MSWQKNWRIIILILLLLITGYWVLTADKLPSFNSEYATAQLQLTATPSGGDFTLESDQGSVSLSQFQNKWVFIYFGYTFCPDICPTNLGNLSLAYRRLSEAQQSQVQILFISVDPERDPPKKLAEYVNFFNSDIIGLTGSKTVLDEITQRYGVVYALHKTPENSKNYSVDHSAFTYLINPKGQLVKQLPHGTNPKQFQQAIEEALQTDS